MVYETDGETLTRITLYPDPRDAWEAAGGA